MGKGAYFHRIRNTFRDSGFDGKKPLVEILGEGRVLIENYTQVLLYEPERIDVAVSFGKLCIRGREMVLKQMSCEQLVISGQIDSVGLYRE